MNAKQPHMRLMTAADVPFVAQIEKTLTPAPWSDNIFRDCLKVGFVCRVMELGGEVVAYGILSHGAGEGHILNLGVSLAWQGQGLGRQMLRTLIADARLLQLSAVFLEVRISNVRAIALYEQEGFNEIGARKDYYPAQGGREDALVFALDIGSSG